MKKYPLLFILLSSVAAFAQTGKFSALQPLDVPDSLRIFNRKLFGDSLTSSFIIEIKKEVKLHRHEYHSEHVYIVSGKAEMKLGDQQIQVNSGDIIFIPKGIPHNVKVTSTAPLRVISIQSPAFDGKDRVMME